MGEAGTDGGATSAHHNDSGADAGRRRGEAGGEGGKDGGAGAAISPPDDTSTSEARRHMT